ncbi:hypothetical protein [Brevibacillus reuszeri]|uniref:hypothetical protein n=1 Tax=Brevibacillus reuszeri TaxID=54915 RepID=UPI003D1A52B6
MENPVADQDKRALLVHPNFPCLSLFKNIEEMNPICKFETKVGLIGESPCYKCLVDNYQIENKNDLHKVVNNISAIPDITYGYNNENIMWLEIMNTSPCSKRKIDLCNDMGIKLLEFSTNEIMSYNDDTEKLTGLLVTGMMYDDYIYMAIEKIDENKQMILSRKEKTKAKKKNKKNKKKKVNI